MKNLKSKNPKDWWNDVKEITGRRSQKNDRQGLANNLCDGDKPKLAEMISASLVAVCDDIIPLTPMDTFDNNKFTHVPDKYIITVSKVEKSLSRINTRKATGPDDIPNWLLRNCAITLAPPICANMCHMECKYPGIICTTFVEIR